MRVTSARGVAVTSWRKVAESQFLPDADGGTGIFGLGEWRRKQGKVRAVTEPLPERRQLRGGRHSSLFSGARAAELDLFVAF